MVNWKKIVIHFQSVDPLLASLVSKKITLTQSQDPFLDLIESIISQQLSVKAGNTIFLRFKNLFPKGITKDAILSLQDQEIRNIGASWSKVSYIKNIAAADIDFHALSKSSDEDVVARLTKIKGVGRWTAEMFLMFSLGREDVFSFGDLALRKAVQKLYQLKNEPTPKQLQAITSKWKPYRTYASRLLWNSLA